jgi:hypothetical protein
MPEVNIHLKTPGAQQAQQALGKTATSARKLGDEAHKGGRKGADGLGALEKKSKGIGNIFTTLKGQVIGFVGAWIGLEGVQKIITVIIQKLERMQQLQATIYQQTISLSELGQKLEYQTGTVGQQQGWAKKAVDLQAAGALKGTDVAQQMMVSADIAFAGMGGIKNPRVMAMLNKIAPIVGSAGFSGSEIAQAFEFAGSAGIQQNAGAYEDYFAKLHTAYTKSKATDPGGFISGLQSGVTGYIGLGGSMAKGMSLFGAARSVIGSEMQAGTAIEQLTRLSGGAYEKPRESLEKALGVKWSNLNMDQRAESLLQHAHNIPASERIQTLVEQGFPAELASVVAKLVSPEARGVLASTHIAVSDATAETETAQVQAYIKSPLGLERRSQAKRLAGKLKAGPAFAAWQRLYGDAESEFEILEAKGKDRWIQDRHEPTVMAMEKMLEQLEASPDYPDKQTDTSSLKHSIGVLSGLTDIHPQAWGKAHGSEWAEYLTEKGVNIHYHNDLNLNPRVGNDPASREAGETRTGDI